MKKKKGLRSTPCSVITMFRCIPNFSEYVVSLAFTLKLTPIMQVTANLVPLNARRVAVRFDTFKIAGFVS